MTSPNSKPTRPRIAVLALQGGYDKHLERLQSLGADAYPARLPADIRSSDGIVIPGGESTTIAKLMRRFEVDTAITEAADLGKPIYGTCAGLIVLSRSVQESTALRGGQQTLGLLDISVVRNAFGRQVDSFEAQLPVKGITPGLFPAVFIRAPYVSAIGAGVEVLAEYEGKSVFVRQGTVFGSSFHPELTDDTRIHEMFLDSVKGK